MFNYSEKELAVIDQQLDPLLVSAAEQGIEAQQLALDATRLLSCTEDRLSDYKNRGFFKRCWSKLSGKTSALERANVNDLIEMQRIGWRYLIMLQERDLLLAHSIVTVKNNLLTLAVKEEETRRSIIDLAERISSRFSVLEDRVGKLEVATNIHSWLLTLDTFDYDEKYPPYIRLLRVVRDFYQLKAGDWNLQEIKYLQKAVKEVGLQPKSKVTIEEFLNCLLDEIEQESVDTFRNLICLPAGESGELIPSRFVLDEIAVPFYASLARIEEDYTDCLRTIEVLADRLNISVQEAHRETLMAFVKKDGIDTSVAIPLRDLAVELLACMGMTAQLYSSRRLGIQIEEASQEISAKKPRSGESGVLDEINRLLESLGEDWSVAEIEAVVTTEMVDTVEVAANTGNTTAQWLFGIFLAGGIHREPELETAVKWIRQAAEKGQADAQYFLGECYLNGNCVPRDEREAVKWLRLAAEQGYPEAQVALGQVLYIGWGVPEDIQESLKWYRLAAEKGEEKALLPLGDLLYYRQGAPEDYLEAVKWYRLAAEKGEVKALYTLGLCYMHGTGVSKNEQEAVRLLRSATEQGLAEAQSCLGLWYLSGLGVSQNAQEAIRLFKLAAEQSDPSGLYGLAMCFHKGIGTPKNGREAVKFFRKAAEQLNFEAMLTLAHLYEEGTEVQQDHQEAVKWYRIAARTGRADAVFDLGRCYLESIGLSYDELEGLRLVQEAAEKGHAEAQFSMGIAYKLGLYGKRPIKVLSQEWLRKAADQGHELAMAELGM